MAERIWKSRVDVAVRVVAALVGTLPAAVFAAIGLARFLPLTEDARFTAGFLLAIPLWVTAMCFVFLARSAPRARSACAVATMLLGALAYGVP